MNIKKTVKKIMHGYECDISVIIPFYNVEDYIADCLDSILLQKGLAIEIILVDDGSTDRSRTIAESYMKKHKGIHLYSTPRKGPGGARNCGVEHAKGEYIAFVDADDIIVRGIYRRMLRAARNNSADVCLCNVCRYSSDKVWSSDLHDKVYHDYKTVTHIKETPELIYDTCATNKLISSRLYRKNRLSFKENAAYEDIIFNAVLHKICNKVVMLAETGYLWRVRESGSGPSITQNFYEEHTRKDRMDTAEQLSELFEEDDVSAELKALVQYRLLETDLRIVLDSAEHVSREEAVTIFDEVNAFTDERIDAESFDSLSVMDLQRFEYVRKKDVDNYKRLMDYRRREYGRAPVDEINGRLVASLPGDLFTVSKRCVNDEFARMTRRTWVDDVRLTESGIIIDSHIYIQRYNMSEPGDQIIRVHLINEETNQDLIIDHEAKPTHFLTDTYGTVKNDASGTVSLYNYDHTGFSFMIDRSLFEYAYKYNRTKYSIVAEYKDRIFSGRGIIKGVAEHNKARFKAAHIIDEKGEIYLDFGAQNELQIIVKKRQ